MKSFDLLNFINEKYKERNDKILNFTKELERDSLIPKNDYLNSEFYISELHMHKILYFLYGYFWKKFEKELFKANFEAWKYGPTEIDFRKNNWNKFKNIILENENEKIHLQELVFKLLKFNVWNLVDESHETSPWKDNYEEGKKNLKINNESIKKYFESE